jgi:chitinase
MPLKAKLAWALALGGAVASLAHAEPERLFSGRPQPFAQTSGKVVGYYLDGDAIADGYRVDPVAARSLTHLLYAFLAICGPGETDAAAKACRPGLDYQLAVTGALDDAALTRYFAALKAEAPHLRILASVGGAMGSKPFYALTRSAEAQARFVRSVTDFLQAHPVFDGVDIDWEFPTDSSPAAGEDQLGRPADGEAYATLMHDLRAALDRLGGGGRRYLLTSAVLTSARLTRAIDYRAAARDTDLFFAMTYDYYGPWAELAGHHTPVVSPEDARIGPVGVAQLLAAGVPAGQIVRGVAAYGRGWQVGPTGRLVTDYDRMDGASLYRELAAQAIGPSGRGIGGYKVEYDRTLRAYSLWNPASRIYIGYDDPRAVIDKGREALKAGLAGLFAWELSGDNGDLLNAMNRGLGNRPRASSVRMESFERRENAPDH